MFSWMGWNITKNDFQLAILWQSCEFEGLKIGYKKNNSLV